MADQVGIKKQALSRVLNGERSGRTYLPRIAKFLGAPVEWLTSGANPPEWARDEAPPLPPPPLSWERVVAEINLALTRENAVLREEISALRQEVAELRVLRSPAGAPLQPPRPLLSAERDAERARLLAEDERAARERIERRDAPQEGETG